MFRLFQGSHFSLYGFQDLILQYDLAACELRRDNALKLRKPVLTGISFPPFRGDCSASNGSSWWDEIVSIISTDPDTEDPSSISTVEPLARLEYNSSGVSREFTVRYHIVCEY